jgi:hypothetical protein
MSTRPTARFPIVALLLVLASAPRAARASTITHVRPMSKDAQAIFDEGMVRSQEMRALVDALEASDLIAYVDLAPWEDALLDGRILFIGSGAGQRYLKIELASARYRAAQMSILGHELRHAVEIASTPSVVDSVSMGRYYDRIGLRIAAAPPFRRYDTRAAKDSGRRVLEEVLAGADAAERAQWTEWVTASKGRK